MGTIVVCVDSRGDPGAIICGELQVGWYYVIRSTFSGFDWQDKPTMAVRVEEIRLTNDRAGREKGIRSSAFRLAESTHSEAGSVRQEAHA